MKIRIILRSLRNALHGCAHGPKTWPWWRLFGLLYCKLGVTPPTTGHRLWIYTRPIEGDGKTGRHVDLFFDRRPRA